MPKFSDEENILSHVVNTSMFNHFQGVEIPIISTRNCIDELIGQSDRALLTVLKEQEGEDPNEPSLVYTRLGPIARGGRVQGSSNSVRTMRVQTMLSDSDCCTCENLKQELATVKEVLREY